MSASPEPPSKVENANWLPADDCVVSNLVTNAVIGISTMLLSTLNGIPLVLFLVWHALVLVGNVPAPTADEVKPVR